MGKAQDTYTIDDLQSDASHLGHLIGAISDHLFDGVDFVSSAGERIRGMDRLNALIWIVRDQIDVLNENIDKHFFDIASSRPAPSEKTTPAAKTSRDAMIAMEPSVLDTHVAAMTAMTIWEAVGHTEPDGSLTLTADEREQMQRVMMDVVVEAERAKTALTECEGAAS